MIERHTSYDELMLWFEHDLFDQLNLIQLLVFVRDHVPKTTPVSLVAIGSFPGRPDFKGLGELSPNEIALLQDTRHPLSRQQYDLAERAWHAFREPTPEALDRLRRDDSSPLPYLAAALTRFLQEFPWTRDGLSRTERRLLTLANDSGTSLRKVFERMHEGEQAYYITDTSLMALAKTLSRTSPRLLDLVVSPDTEDALSAIVAPTEAGRSVLTGQLDRVRACGIDRWLGGVYLGSGGALWRWDETLQRVIRATD